ncbi:MAG: hypothetical protein LBK95_03990 [Bifidobacteriaceae bacterium]|nr:hypothetical protein [Bifidobacteriaceae bacterium]
MEIRDKGSNTHRIDSRAWYAVQDQLFEMFMARVPENRVRLREIVAADGGPELDLSIRSLDNLGEWFVGWARRDPDDSESWESPYVDHRYKSEGVNAAGRRAESPQMERMRVRLAVYLGDVAMGVVPGSRWVCWRGEAVGDRFAGDAVVDVGNPETPFNALIFSGWVCGAAYSASFDPSNPNYQPPKPHEWSRLIGWMLGRLEKRHEEGLEPEFQPAPTGPEAKGRKRPHSGRREYEALKRDGVY